MDAATTSSALSRDASRSRAARRFRSRQGDLGPLSAARVSSDPVSKQAEPRRGGPHGLGERAECRAVVQPVDVAGAPQFVDAPQVALAPQPAMTVDDCVDELAWLAYGGHLLDLAPS